MLTDGNDQRAVAGFLLGDVQINGRVEQQVFIGGEALHHDAGFIQIGWGQLGFAVDQRFNLARYQVLLVRPELHLPGTVAFRQRAEGHRLHGCPGTLRAGKGLAGLGEILLASAEGLAAGGQLAVSFAPGAVDR